MLFAEVACFMEGDFDAGLGVKSLFHQVAEDFTNRVLAGDKLVVMFLGGLGGLGCVFHVNLLVCYSPILSGSYITVKGWGETRFARKRLTARVSRAAMNRQVSRRMRAKRRRLHALLGRLEVLHEPRARP